MTETRTLKGWLVYILEKIGIVKTDAETALEMANTLSIFTKLIDERLRKCEVLISGLQDEITQLEKNSIERVALEYNSANLYNVYSVVKKNGNKIDEHIIALQPEAYDRMDANFGYMQMEIEDIKERLRGLGVEI